ncbi:hypothetical protein CPB86DRAFT_789234 [Serendipita vermifera]|nr:hypothetical protein CPB86DRAFT_789234 [Serendipita vermifera]
MQTHDSEAQRLHNIFDEARQKFQKYSPGPAPADLFERAQWTMSNAHLLIVDSIQSVYDQADTIRENQQAAFVQYSYICQQSLHHHHWFEETIAFPMLEPEFKCDVLEEHALFSEAMDRWEKYLEELLGLEKGEGGKAVPVKGKARATYDGKRMKKCIEDLSGPLFTHLQHEIDWLAPEKIRACGLPLSKLEQLEASSEHHFQNETDPFTSGVWSVIHARPGSYFPPMPWFVKKILMPWVFCWKFRAAWQFAPRYNKTAKRE